MCRCEEGGMVIPTSHKRKIYRKMGLHAAVTRATSFFDKFGTAAVGSTVVHRRSSAVPIPTAAPSTLHPPKGKFASARVLFTLGLQRLSAHPLNPTFQNNGERSTLVPFTSSILSHVVQAFSGASAPRSRSHFFSFFLSSPVP